MFEPQSSLATSLTAKLPRDPELHAVEYKHGENWKAEINEDLLSNSVRGSDLLVIRGGKVQEGATAVRVGEQRCNLIKPKV